MAPTANPRVTEAVSGLFGIPEGADCDIQFCLEGDGGGTDLGPPLPAHSLVLRLACERFRAQFDRWTRRQPPSGKSASHRRPLRVRVQPLKKVLWPKSLRKPAPRKPLRLRVRQGKRTGPQTPRKVGGRPLLRVPLGSEAELPAARLAIRFAYAGQVHASSIREALEVLRAGDYLAIEGCAAACSQWLADRLAATGAEAAGAAEPAEPAVLQLYACEGLWPSGDPSFAAVLSAAKAQLVRHFGSTLAALNMPALTKQLEALGPKGLEALLESDDLATDSEDSVLTLLATWMRANWARTDAATRQRLCGLVRLAQLSLEATNCLLFALAADYEVKGPEQQAGWFPMTVTDAQVVVTYVSSAGLCQKKTREEQAAARAPGWHSPSPRKQWVPQSGIDHSWSISKEALRAKLEALQPGQTAFFNACFGSGKADLTARGFTWEVRVEHCHGSAAAGLFLTPQIPAAFKVPGSRLAGPVPKLAACIDARLSVDSRLGGGASVASVHYYSRAEPTRVGLGWGWPDDLPLAPQQPAPETATAAGADVLARWAQYSHQGSAVSGTLRLLPHR